MEEWNVKGYSLKMTAEQKEQLKELLAMKEETDKEKEFWRSQYMLFSSKLKAEKAFQRAEELEVRRKCKEQKVKLEAALRECSESGSSQGSSLHGPSEPGPSKPGPSK